jgi:predicted anti-sigma-YlaC factor YlaD
MNQHYSEADLLETYYTQPGESLPVMLHLADCPDCAARYERLDLKIRSLADGHHHTPEQFWVRQRASIMRRIGVRRRLPVLARFAAAAMLALVIGATISWPLLQQPKPAAETIVSDDPWESEPLQAYQPLVEWESWVEPEGGQS